MIWDFDDSSTSLFENPMHEFENPGIYNVMLTVSDTNLCVDSIVHKIIMYYDYVLYVPNTFTPNGDGENDEFVPIGLRMEKYESYQFIIYNRWGEILFESDDINKGWNGTTRDGENIAPIGVYLYFIEVENIYGEIFIYQDALKLMR